VRLLDTAKILTAHLVQPKMDEGNKIEVVLGGIKAVYSGGPTIELIDRLTNKQFDSISVIDERTGMIRIEFTVHDVKEELDRAVHYEEYR
jgi:hypothetical protein